MSGLTPTERRIMDAVRDVPPWVPKDGLTPVLLASIIHGQDGHAPKAINVLRHMRALVRKGQLVEPSSRTFRLP